MPLYTLAEIVTLDGVVDSAKDYLELAAKLLQYWRDTGAWCAGIAAGDADEPMHVLATVDATGILTWSERARQALFVEEERNTDTRGPVYDDAGLRSYRISRDDD